MQSTLKLFMRQRSLNYCRNIVNIQNLNFLIVDGIPVVHHFGTENENNYMVIDVLGPSLEDLFNYCGRQFSLKTTMMLII